MGRIQVCFVVTPVWYEVGQFFFPVYFPTSFKNQNIVFKKKTVLLKLLKVTATLRRNPPSKDSLQKMLLGKLIFFCIVLHYFSKTKCKSAITIMQQCFSCQNKSICQKLARSCKKWKSPQKVIYALFAWNPSILLVLLAIILHLHVSFVFSWFFRYL